MQSIRSRIIIGMLRNRHLFKGKLRKERADGNFSPGEFRAAVERASLRMKLPGGFGSEKREINGIKAEWIIPEKSEGEGMLMYIHGGGFISGSCLTHRSHVAKFAGELGMKALVFDYRLAPEHPFPAALEDCLSLYGYLTEKVAKPEDIIVGGESAGGTLVLSLLLALGEKGLPQPRGAFSISPLADFSCRADSFVRNAPKDIALLDSWHLWGDYYCDGQDRENPLISPLYGDYSRTAPLLLMAGTHEVHLDDVRELASRIADQEGRVQYSEWPRMVHAFPILAPFFPEATRALKEIGEFCRALRKEQRG